MTRIIYIPIEPYAERYTTQWMKWFPLEFAEAGYDVLTLLGESLTGGVIKTGEVLDITSAYYWEFTQMLKLIKMFHKGKITKDDIIFCADIEYPGHNVAAKFLSTLLKIPCKIYGFIHAGTYTREDFIVPCKPFQKYFELGWLVAFDGVFVGSNYHKIAITDSRILELAYEWDMEKLINKIHVSGDPWYTDEALKMVGLTQPPKPNDRMKDIDVILPNLPDYRKRPNLTLDFAIILKECYPQWKIVACTSREKYMGRDRWINAHANVLNRKGIIELREGLSKADYYSLLARSKTMLSTSIEETFGYCPVEGMTFNCNPILPNNYSYPEVVDSDEDLLYNGLDEALEKLILRWATPKEVFQYAKKYEGAIKNMIKVMESG